MMVDTPPQPPFFLIPNINNLRDPALFHGSLPTTSPAGIIRPGILFRSAEVSKLDQAGWKAVHDIGVGHVFDLRSKPEVDKGWGGIVGKEGEGVGDVRPGWITGMEKENVKREWVPVFEESDYSPERLAERYSKYMGESVEVCTFLFCHTNFLCTSISFSYTNSSVHMLFSAYPRPALDLQISRYFLQ